MTDDPILNGCDPGIRDAVRLLRGHGVNTCQSCQGGPGHAYKRPTVDFITGDPTRDAFDADDFVEAERVVAFAVASGLPVRDLAMRRLVVDGKLTEPTWSLILQAPADHWWTEVQEELAVLEIARREGIGVEVARRMVRAAFAAAGPPSPSSWVPVEEANRVLSEEREWAARARYRNGWEFTTHQHVEHVEGCECEHADGWLLESIDPRCTEGPERTVAALDDGLYTRFVIDLDHVKAALDRWEKATGDSEPPAGLLLTRDGVIPLATLDFAAVSPPEEATEAERERIYSLLRALASDGDCGCDQYCTCGQSGGCCHWYHMDPEIRHPGPTQDLLRAIVNGTDQQ